MASTFSNLGLNLQATGENSGTWGYITNVNLQDIDNAIAGVVTVTVTGNTTLAFTTNSSSTTFTDEAGRNKVIRWNSYYFCWRFNNRIYCNRFKKLSIRRWSICCTNLYSNCSSRWNN